RIDLDGASELFQRFVRLARGDEIASPGEALARDADPLFQVSDLCRGYVRRLGRDEVIDRFPLRCLDSTVGAGRPQDRRQRTLEAWIERSRRLMSDHPPCAVDGDQDSRES